MPILGPDGTSQRLIDQASLIVLERMLAAEGIDPAPLSRSPDDWSGLEAQAARWIDTVASALAYAIVASISVIDFEAVIIDGGMPAALRDDLVQKTRSAMAKHDLQGLAVPAVEAGTMGPIARAKGAASLPLFAGSVLAGAVVGTTMGIRFRPTLILKMLGVVLIVAGLKLMDAF